MNQTAETGYAPLSDYFKKINRSDIASPLTSIDLVRDSESDAFYFRRLEQGGTKLNKQQIEAVRVTSGPVLINAGAGSGKTTVFIARTGYLLQVEGVPASSVMLVTFTKKAADELSSRIRRLPGMKMGNATQITVGTFHSIFLQMLREVGVQRKILSSERYQHIIIKQIMRKLHMADA
jgi:DNA helicase-2/ATP-dependent DNA helicase PcrA